MEHEAQVFFMVSTSYDFKRLLILPGSRKHSSLGLKYMEADEVSDRLYAAKL